jgi:hypothetical protein
MSSGTARRTPAPGPAGKHDRSSNGRNPTPHTRPAHTDRHADLRSTELINGRAHDQSAYQVKLLTTRRFRAAWSIFIETPFNRSPRLRGRNASLKSCVPKHVKASCWIAVPQSTFHNPFVSGQRYRRRTVSFGSWIGLYASIVLVLSIHLWRWYGRRHLAARRLCGWRPAHAG